MTDSNEKGCVRFWIRPPEDGWNTNDKTYIFAPYSAEGISVSVGKHSDRKIEARISGPFLKTYRFVVDIPVCDQRGLWVLIQWSDGKVTLFLNNQEMETKQEDSNLIDMSAAAFSSTTDEGVRTLEMAIAFNISANYLLEMTIANVHATLRDLPAILAPLVVCESFAIELYLKSLHHFDHNSSARGHNLEDLFDSLLPNTQQRIREVYNDSFQNRGIPVDRLHNGMSRAFEDVLTACSRAFETWRYIHEISTRQSPVANFIGGPLMNAIREVARERYPSAFEKK